MVREAEGEALGSNDESKRVRPRSLTTGWAVAARASLVAVLVGLCFVSLAPDGYVPSLLYSHHLEHFAAFYIVTLVALAALPRSRFHRVGAALILLALALEFGQMLLGQSVVTSYQNFIADTGGVFAAVLPMVLERARGVSRSEG